MRRSQRITPELTLSCSIRAETTAHTLAFVFTLLALYPEHQDILYAEAEAAFGGRSSMYEDYGKLVSPLSPSVSPIDSP